MIEQNEAKRAALSTAETHLGFAMDELAQALKALEESRHYEIEMRLRDLRHLIGDGPAVAVAEALRGERAVPQW